jgi:hypothetical protein
MATDPGTISIPMSSVLDALEGILTEAERAQLFEQLIGLRPDTVAPGDLITAELFNQVRSDINGLLARVATLEGAAGGPVIESLDPSSNVAVNSLLAVNGSNFNIEPNFNIVRIGDKAITQFREESSPTQLLFPVPDLFSNLPQTLPVRVETGGRTSNVMQITIQEEDKIQKGKFEFGPAVVPPGDVEENKTVAITWEVQAITMYDDNVALALIVGDAVGTSAAAWLNQLSFQPAAPVAILAGKSKQVTANVRVPLNAKSAKISLKVTSADGHVSNISDAVAIEVGKEVALSSPKNDLVLSVIGNGLTKGKVTINGLEGDGVLVKKSNTDKGSIKITLTDARLPADGQQPINLAFQAQFTATASGLVFNPDYSPKTVSNVAYHDDRSFFVPLDASAATVGATAQLKASFTQTNTVDATKLFTSWLVIPLKIVA